MKPLPIQQEILLMTNSSVTRQELCELNANRHSGALDATEQLEQACWDGLLNEMIPGVLNTTASGKALFLWLVQPANSFLHLVLSEEPLMGYYVESIDPYIFLHFVHYN